jgi:hypothetical protein
MFDAMAPHGAVNPITVLGLVLLKNLSTAFASNKFILLLVAAIYLRLFNSKFLHVTNPAKPLLP